MQSVVKFTNLLQVGAICLQYSHDDISLRAKVQIFILALLYLNNGTWKWKKSGGGSWKAAGWH